jgi:outer membrane protein TolC
MPQSSFAMKWLGILLVALMSGLSARAADTNTSTIDTNLSSAPDEIYAELTNSLASETNTPQNIRQLSLQDCIELALKDNLDLQIDRYNPQIALYTLKKDYGDYDPLLSLSGQHEHSKSGPEFVGTNLVGGASADVDSFSSGVTGNLPWGTTYGIQGNIAGTDETLPTIGIIPNTGGSVSGNVTQPLLKNLWIDSTRLAIRVDKNRLKYSELELKLNVMTTITTLEQAYYDLVYDRENVLVQQSAAEQTDRLVMESKKKLEVGALAPLDLASAEAQAAQNRSAIIAAKSQLGTQERKVKQLITDRFLDWADVELVPTGTLTAPRVVFNRQDSWSKALAQRPEFLQAKLDAEKAGVQLKFDWNQLFPELDVFGTYGYNGSGTYYGGAFNDIEQMNRRFYIFGGKLNMPLANISARDTYKSDKVTLQQLVLAIKKEERDILIAVDNDIGTLQADYDAVQATHAQRLYEEEALDAEQKKLDNGKSTTYQVLLVQRDLTSARGAEIQALDTYNKDLAQLSLDEGSTLERLNIDFQAK